MRFSFHGPLAQSVEQRTFNPLVAGSTPARPTNKMRYILLSSVDLKTKLCFKIIVDFPDKSVQVTCSAVVFIATIMPTFQKIWISNRWILTFFSTKRYHTPRKTL